MKARYCTRRQFLNYSLKAVAGAPLLGLAGRNAIAATQANTTSSISRDLLANARVAIVPCKTYGAAVGPALDKCFDLLGGIGSLVKNKTVTIKLNLTGTNFRPFLDGRPVGETYMTHYDTALALAKSLFAAGAKRVRFVESTQSSSQLASTLALADWDVKALEALGTVEFENTRNLGNGKSY